MITTRTFISHIIKYLGAKAILDDVQELHRHLIFPGIILDGDVGGQGVADTHHVVGAAQVHQSVIHGLGIVHLLAHKEIPQAVGADAPVAEVQNGGPEGF